MSKKIAMNDIKKILEREIAEEKETKNYDSSDKHTRVFYLGSIMKYKSQYLFFVRELIDKEFDRRKNPDYRRVR